MTNEEMKTIALGYFDAVCAADADRLRALFSEDVHWRIPKGAIPPYGGTHRGAEKVIDMMLSAVGQSFVAGSQKFHVQTILVGDGVVCAETEMTAQAPDGRNYRNDYTFFFKFEGENISEIREHVDTRYAAEFFG
jgi:ketosteroid isomerase-like protein